MINSVTVIMRSAIKPTDYFYDEFWWWLCFTQFTQYPDNDNRKDSLCSANDTQNSLCPLNDEI